jgi:hypothetical protein
MKEEGGGKITCAGQDPNYLPGGIKSNYDKPHQLENLTVKIRIKCFWFSHA